MQLEFQEVSIIGTGSSPDFLQFPKTEGQLFYLSSEELFGRASEKLHGEFVSPIWLDSLAIGSDTMIKGLELSILQGFGVIGSYNTNDAHKMLIYEFSFDMDRYLTGGSITHSMDTPIATFTLQLENPINENPEYEGNAAISEDSSLISPGSKIVFEFRMGDSETYPMGVFYVDRSQFSLLNETVTVDGRNVIGKALHDQTFDEENTYTFQVLHETFKDILYRANISSDEMLVENTAVKAGYTFDVKMNCLEGIMEVLKALENWQIKELVDGTVVIGSQNYAGFTKNSRYTFQRNKEIFTRNIVRDDQDAYRRVCVHDQDFIIKVYRDVATYSGWNLQTNKTLYVNVPEGTSLSDAQVYAEQIANNLEYVGKIESFTGPFRPQLILGDEAVIVGEKGSKNLGLITEITHRFGKEGFYTDFTVDSGGRIANGRLSDYIGKITKEKTSSSRIYE